MLLAADVSKSPGRFRGMLLFALLCTAHKAGPKNGHHNSPGVNWNTLDAYCCPRLLGVASHNHKPWGPVVPVRVPGSCSTLLDVVVMVLPYILATHAQLIECARRAKVSSTWKSKNQQVCQPPDTHDGHAPKRRAQTCLLLYTMLRALVCSPMLPAMFIA